jgi:ribosomal protein S27AE
MTSLDPDEIKRVKVHPVKCPRCNLTIFAKLGDGVRSVCGDDLLAATK